MRADENAFASIISIDLELLLSSAHLEAFWRQPSMMRTKPFWKDDRRASFGSDSPVTDNRNSSFFQEYVRQEKDTEV
jgi:hypothetical protein